MLNAQQIVEKGLLKLEYSRGKAAQVGYDLSLKSVNKIGGGSLTLDKPAKDADEYYAAATEIVKQGRYTVGKVLKERTQLINYSAVEMINLDGIRGYLLHPGVYDITFWEGCKIPSNYVGLIRQRSSMLRNGTVLHSSVFDPGFETEFMGTVMAVNVPIFVEEDARVAQIYFHTCGEVAGENLYNGQWQQDKQRNA